MAAEFGFAQGFETYELLLDQDERLGYARAEVLVDRALVWLGEERKEPFFLYLHATDPHDPYTFTPGGRESFGSTDFMEALEAGQIPSDARTREKLLELYDEKIRYVDRELGRLFDDLRKKGLYQDSLIVLVSDHGEEFEEHGWWRHGKTLYQEQLHVPFLVKWPEGAAAGRRLRDVVQHVDLVPTVLDFLGEPLPRDLPGRSLHRLVESGAAFDPVVSSYLVPMAGKLKSSSTASRSSCARSSTIAKRRPLHSSTSRTTAPRRRTSSTRGGPPSTSSIRSSVVPPEAPSSRPSRRRFDQTVRRRLEALSYIR